MWCVIQTGHPAEDYKTADLLDIDTVRDNAVFLRGVRHFQVRFAGSYIMWQHHNS